MKHYYCRFASKCYNNFQQFQKISLCCSKFGRFSLYPSLFYQKCSSIWPMFIGQIEKIFTPGSYSLFSGFSSPTFEARKKISVVGNPLKEKNCPPWLDSFHCSFQLGANNLQPAIQLETIVKLNSLWYILMEVLMVVVFVIFFFAIVLLLL